MSSLMKMQSQPKGTSCRLPSRAKKSSLIVRAGQKADSSSVTQQLASAALASMLSIGALAGVANASEFDIIGEEAKPNTHYFVDDANVLSKSTRGDIDYKLKRLEIETGYRVTAVTVRKLEFETDTFAFADKVLESWYPTPEAGDKNGIVLVVTAGKEGAVTGGKSFSEAVGDELIESVVVDNIPIFSEQEKYNQCVTSSLDRIDAKLRGEAVPAAPKREEGTRQRTYKTKEEVEKSKSVTSTVVITLLVIAVVVPMLQYYGYTARD